MAKGTVVRFDEVRGYGFIAPDTGGEDVFVHINDLGDEKTNFSTGTPVEFQVTEGERGLKAYGVRVLRQPGPVPAPAPVPASALVATVARPFHDDSGGDADDDALSDVLSVAECTDELTELFLAAAPELTGAQIVTLRQRLVGWAKEHGWVET